MIAIIGILAGLTIPAVQAVRRSALQTECANRLRQIGIATINYQASRGHFPSGINAPDHPEKPSLGGHFVHADGAVRIYDYAVDPTLNPALATFAGGEPFALQ